MTPRVSPPGHFDDDQLRELAKAPTRPDGAPLNLFATLAHDPELLRRVNALGGYFVRRGRLSFRTREIVILRVAGHVGSAYELAYHRVAGASAGLTPIEIAAAEDPGHPSLWSESDGAVLAFVDELLAHRTVTDGTWDALAPDIDPIGRIELCLLIGFYVMIGGMLGAVGVEPDPLSR